MKWNWELPNWPNFTYNVPLLPEFEKKFLFKSGGTATILKYLDINQQKQFIVEILCHEAMNSAEIEGELLRRESLQVSIQRHFGLTTENCKAPILPEEQGMADLMCAVYDTYEQTLTHEMLYQWHALLMAGESKIMDIGQYRTHSDPMQIISNRYDKHTVYFEAPPSDIVHHEMTQFIQWFNQSKNNLTILTRAAIAHVYFESIHPFEDGNGRIGRALVEKVLSQELEQPTLIAVSHTIAKRKKEYYTALGSCNKNLDIGYWITFFSEVILEAQEESLAQINFLIKKSKLMNYLKGKINERQEKALLRMFAEGVSGFAGGLSAENYIKITKISRATATRDLIELVDLGALLKTGQLRHTRYWLNLENI